MEIGDRRFMTRNIYLEDIPLDEKLHGHTRRHREEGYNEGANPEKVDTGDERRQKGDDPLWRRAKRLLVRQPALLDDAARDRLHSLLERNPRLATVYQFRERLRELWSGATNVSNDKLVRQCSGAMAFVFRQDKGSQQRRRIGIDADHESQSLRA